MATAGEHVAGGGNAIFLGPVGVGARLNIVVKNNGLRSACIRVDGGVGGARQHNAEGFVGFDVAVLNDVHRHDERDLPGGNDYSAGQAVGQRNVRAHLSGARNNLVGHGHIDVKYFVERDNEVYDSGAGAGAFDQVGHVAGNHHAVAVGVAGKIDRLHCTATITATATGARSDANIHLNLNLHRYRDGYNRHVVNHGQYAGIQCREPDAADAGVVAGCHFT